MCVAVAKGMVDEGLIWTIVLAGGRGTRLASLTRAIHDDDRAKQFAFIEPERSVLQATVARAVEICEPARLSVVVAEADERLARAQLAHVAVGDLVLQPRNAGTGPGLLLPLVRILRRAPEATVVVLPSDHFVEDASTFIDTIRRLAMWSREHDGRIALLGAVADRPETGYGWIVPGAAESVTSVIRFVEKPREAAARELLGGGALWNTFVLAGSARRLWETAREKLPTQVSILEHYAKWLGSPRETEILRRSYERLLPADFCASVLAGAAGLAVARLPPCGWSDWGTPERVFVSLEKCGRLEPFLARIGPSRVPDLLAPRRPPRAAPRNEPAQVEQVIA